MHYPRDSKIPDDIKNLMELIDEFFGCKARRVSISIENKCLHYIIYNAFEVKFELGDRYGEFGAGVVMGNYILGPEILPGSRILMDSGRETTLQNLKLIEEYCRLRLPDKFLEYHGW